MSTSWSHTWTPRKASITQLHVAPSRHPGSFLSIIEIFVYPDIHQIDFSRWTKLRIVCRFGCVGLMCLCGYESAITIGPPFWLFLYCWLIGLVATGWRSANLPVRIKYESGGFQNAHIVYRNIEIYILFENDLIQGMSAFCLTLLRIRLRDLLWQKDQCTTKAMCIYGLSTSHTKLPSLTQGSPHAQRPILQCASPKYNISILEKIAFDRGRQECDLCACTWLRAREIMAFATHDSTRIQSWTAELFAFCILHCSFSWQCCRSLIFRLDGLSFAFPLN